MKKLLLAFLLFATVVVKAAVPPYEAFHTNYFTIWTNGNNRFVLINTNLFSGTGGTTNIFYFYQTYITNIYNEYLVSSNVSAGNIQGTDRRVAMFNGNGSSLTNSSAYIGTNDELVVEGNIDTNSQIGVYTTGWYATTNHIQGLVNVRAFGAVGDGVTDDSAAFRSALDSSFGNGVFVPQGTYKLLSTLQLYSGQSLVGPSPATRWFDSTTNTAAVLKFYVTNGHGIYMRSESGVNVDSVTLRNLYIDGANSSGTSDGINVSADNSGSAVKHLRVIDTHIRDFPRYQFYSATNSFDIKFFRVTMMNPSRGATGDNLFQLVDPANTQFALWDCWMSQYRPDYWSVNGPCGDFSMFGGTVATMASGASGANGVYIDGGLNIEGTHFEPPLPTTHTNSVGIRWKGRGARINPDFVVGFGTGVQLGIPGQSWDAESAEISGKITLNNVYDVDIGENGSRTNVVITSLARAESGSPAVVNDPRATSGGVFDVQRLDLMQGIAWRPNKVGILREPQTVLDVGGNFRFGTNGWMTMYDTASAVVQQHDGKPWQLYSTQLGEPQIHVATNGNVGILTNSPTDTLHVRGSAKIGSATDGLRIYDQANQAVLGLPGIQLAIWDSVYSVHRLLILTNGTVQISGPVEIQNDLSVWTNATVSGTTTSGFVKANNVGASKLVQTDGSGVFVGINNAAGFAVNDGAGAFQFRALTLNDIPQLLRATSVTDPGTGLALNVRASNDSTGYAGMTLQSNDGNSTKSQWFWQASDNTFRFNHNGGLAYYIDTSRNVNFQAGIKVANASQWTSGAGSPETVVTAPVGSLYTRTDGGAGTTLYVKESGTGNTGWIAK